jgi:hypothetical protein
MEITKSARTLGKVLMFGIATSSLVIRGAAGQTAKESARIYVNVGGTPVTGALVALIDSHDLPIVEGLTKSTGRVTLTAPVGQYRVRVRRVGFAPYISSTVVLPAKGEIALAITEQRIALSTVIVTAGTQCRTGANDSRDIGLIWEEISKALLGTQLTRRDMSGDAEARTYSKEVHYDGDVVSLDTSRVKLSGARPFAAITPSSLASRGYVRGDIRSGWEYYGPDEAVLLSASFAETHCFRIVRNAAHSGEVGLSFEPAPGRRISDIEGTLWLDEKSSELHEMTFRFVNIGLVDRFKPGGRVHFLRTASGAWLVDDWMLRFPSLQQRIGGDESLIEVGYKEHGGSIVSPARTTASSQGGYATLRGSVFDSTSGVPLGGATITVGEASAVSGVDGSFSLDSIAWDVN